jgi:hypothetical protein
VTLAVFLYTHPIRRNPTVEACLFKLKHRKSSHIAITDLSDPYNKAMSTFQAFTNSIIDGLERNDAEVVSLIHGDILNTLYSGYPTFEPNSFRWRARDSILKHPHRRWPKQAEFIKILQFQGADISLKKRVYVALVATKDSAKRVMDPPSPMPKILDRVAPHRAGQELHGIRPVQYWTLRETT